MLLKVHRESPLNPDQLLLNAMLTSCVADEASVCALLKQRESYTLDFLIRTLPNKVQKRSASSNVIEGDLALIKKLSWQSVTDLDLPCPGGRATLTCTHQSFSYLIETV